MIILPFVTCVRSGISCSPSYCCNTFELHELHTFTTMIIFFFLVRVRILVTIQMSQRRKKYPFGKWQESNVNSVPCTLFGVSL